MKDFGEFIYLLLLAFIGIIANGFVFMKMWQWIVQPTFNTVQLGFAQSVAIMIVFSFLLFKKKEDGAKDLSGITELFLGQLFTTLIFLGGAWIIQLYL